MIIEVNFFVWMVLDPLLPFFCCNMLWGGKSVENLFLAPFTGLWVVRYIELKPTERICAILKIKTVLNSMLKKYISLLLWIFIQNTFHYGLHFTSVDQHALVLLYCLTVVIHLNDFLKFFLFSSQLVQTTLQIPCWSNCENRMLHKVNISTCNGCLLFFNNDIDCAVGREEARIT